MNPEAGNPDKDTAVWSVAATLFLLILLAAAGLRFYALDLKPLHHDEGVNSYFLLNLARAGEYKYDPTNYHGPTLYYFAIPALMIFGESEFALRFWPALFGVLTVAMIWLIRHHLGPAGTVAAALCLGLSPGLVYFSRDFIHEMSFGCFSLGMIIGAVRYAETKNVIWMILASLSAGLLFATKETAIITLTTALIALASATLFDIARSRLTRQPSETPFRRQLGAVLPSYDHLLAGVIIFLSVNIILYTSLLSHWGGVVDAIKSVWYWSQRSGSEHVKSFAYYFGILFKLELPLLIGSLIAGAIIVFKGSRFWLFTGAWTMGITLAYSIIGYKTPWLLVSLLIPMAIVSGYGVQWIFDKLKFNALKAAWMGLIAVIALFCFRLCVTVNFVKYDDNTNSSGYFVKWGESRKLKPYIDGQHGYVYAQTDRDLLNLVKVIKTETSARPMPDYAGIYIALPEYWPLPWYLRDFKHVSYSGALPLSPGAPPAISQPIIIGGVNQRSELDRLPNARPLSRTFILRPGVDLVLYFQNEEREKQQ